MHYNNHINVILRTLISSPPLSYFPLLYSPLLSSPLPPLLSYTAHKIEMDAFGLAQLQRRVKDAAQSKAKIRTREKEGGLGYRDQDQTFQKSGDFSLRFNPGGTLRGSTKSGTKEGGREERGGIRKRYQDLAEVQQKASILLEEYHTYAAIRRRNQVT